MARSADPTIDQRNLRIAVLYDGKSLRPWQKRALDSIAGGTELYFLVTDGEKTPKRRPVQHLGYYLTNLLAIKRAAGSKVAYEPDKSRSERTYRFTPEYDGAWAKLPAEAAAWLKQSRIDAVVKFGLSLLRIPDGLPPILSYHHGDPRDYRGRPAGFYELLEGATFQGQIIQRLNNRVDGGEVLAFTQSRVVRHSYRKSLAAAYSLSPHLLRSALHRLQHGEALDIAATGKNYRLPGNLQVAQAVLTMLVQSIKRVFYGAFVEKKWQVSTLPSQKDDFIADLTSAESRASGSVVPIPQDCSFVADPFFHSEAVILAEALVSRDGKGRIARIDDDGTTLLTMPRQEHYSYPFCFRHEGQTFVIPEMARSGVSEVHRLDGRQLTLAGVLDVPCEGLLDPTLFRQDDTVFLFANTEVDGANVLRLFWSAGLFEPFKEHRASPIRVSTRGSRMAGSILRDDDRLLRLGQDFRESYGDGLIVFEIEALDRNLYRERELKCVAFEAISGPHTANFSSDRMVFDWYTETIAPFAWWRRIRNRL